MKKDFNEKKPKVEKARQLCQQLCDGSKEGSQKFDLKNKLASVDKPYGDIGKKIGMIFYSLVIKMVLNNNLSTQGAIQHVIHLL